MPATTVRARRLRLLIASLSLVAAAPGMAQTGPGWIDPPPQGDAPRKADQPPSGRVPPLPTEEDYEAQPDEPAAPAPSAGPQPRSAPPKAAAAPAPTVEPPAPPAARASGPAPPDEGRAGSGASARAARQLAVDYLGTWSAPNPVALAAAPGFYAPKVTFHGRLMSVRALIEGKRRFVQRWPQRYYAPRLGSVRTTCAPAGHACTVRTVFDFTALNPSRGARSHGTANLELGIRFANGQPMIVLENSRVTRRGLRPRRTALDSGSE